MPKDPKFDQLAESLIFRPWPKGDPALSLILEQVGEAERSQILTSAVRAYRESLAAEMTFVDTVMNVLSTTKAP